MESLRTAKLLLLVCPSFALKLHTNVSELSDKKCYSSTSQRQGDEGWVLIAVVFHLFESIKWVWIPLRFVQVRFQQSITISLHPRISRHDSPQLLMLFPAQRVGPKWTSVLAKTETTSTFRSFRLCYHAPLNFSTFRFCSTLTRRDYLVPKS